MAAKKSAKKASTSSTATRTVQTSDNVQSIEEPKRAPQPETEKAEIPTIDPTVSSDNRVSTYKDANDNFPPDTGNQVEEIPGKPKA